MYRVALFFLLFLLSEAADVKAIGNHLYPLGKNNISLQKENLDIRFVKYKGFEIRVEYVFFNPGNDVMLDIGFDANPPYIEFRGPVFKKDTHPEISDFVVSLNDQKLPVNLSFTGRENYYKNGKVLAIPFNRVKKGTGYQIIYLFHFKAKLKKGLNKMTHTYTITKSLSYGKSYFYSLLYDMKNASKWGNGVIDDFNLVLDLGDYKALYVDKDFFRNRGDLYVNGNSRMHDTFFVSDMDTEEYPASNDTFFYTELFIRKGKIEFQKKNFKPADNLLIFHGESGYYSYSQKPWDHESYAELFIDIGFWEQFDSTKVWESSYKILKNLPYARRGYVSPDKHVQDYFEKMAWYWPDPAYIPDEALLTEEERKWLTTIIVIEEPGDF